MSTDNASGYKKMIVDDIQFHKLCSDLSSKLVYIPSKNIDAAINESLEQICNFLGFDISSLWQVYLEDPKYSFLTHFYRRYGGETIPDKLISRESFPWTLHQIINKKVIIYSDPDSLPPEATVDIASRHRFGLLSGVNFPLFVGEGNVFGSMSFNTVKERIDWTDDVVAKLQFLAQIFANAIFRKRTEKIHFDNSNFERFISTLSSKFINVPVDEIDNIINESLKQICDLMQFDLSALWQLNRENPEEAFLTHYFRRYTGPDIPVKMQAKKSFPWTLKKILRKEILKYRNASELPPEAHIDIQTRKHYNLKSNITFPLYIGNQPVFGIISFNTINEEIDWTEDIINKLNFVVQIFANALSRKFTENILLDNLKFEKLLSSLSVRFVNVHARNVDNEINESLIEICNILGFDIAALWQLRKENPDEAYLTHYYRRYGGPTVPDRMEAGITFPWSLKKVLKKEIVKLKNVSDLPPDAEVESVTRLHYGIKSDLVFPLFFGNEPVFGILSLNTVKEEFNWTEEVIIKLQLISQVFANALSRKLSDNILRENEERLRLAASSASAGFWDLILSTSKIWTNESLNKIYCIETEKNLYLSDFIKRIHPEDRARVEKDIQKAADSGNYYNKHRILLPDGQTRWIFGRGHILSDSEGKPNRLLGISIDITRDKEIEKTLKDSEELKTSIINSVRSHLIVIDKNGTIMAVNESWKKFTVENSQKYSEYNVDIGENYLSVLENSDKNGSKFALKHLKGIKSVLNGKSLKYETQYALNSTSGKLWFLLTATPLIGEEKGAVIVHRNITELKETQISLENALADVRQLKEQLQKDNIYLKEEIKLHTNFENILGSSDAIKYCLFNVEKVAPLNTTVLIYGETGTGKELIARAIHDASPRSNRPLIKVDCSTLPPSIIESELFGREKGAYTDAKSRNIGRFELANGSTLFLDEISELPLELQSKLLRVTQYGEFERLGSSKTHKADVRLIVATNRDLEEEVKKKRFREDLFFRLNVFRITIPPLRERIEDIPIMVKEFVKNMNRKLGKNIEFISQSSLNKLMAYSWPGNVRELENLIEYCVITSNSNELEVKLVSVPAQSPYKKTQDVNIVPLSELEKEYIIKVLETTNWKIEGQNSASELLKMAPSTLRDRMKKLNIKRKNK